MELKDVELKECTVADLDDVYNVQQLMIDSFKEEEKTFYLPDPKEYLEEMLNSDHHLGWLYGAYYKNKMIGFICLSISPSVKNLFAMVPDLEGNSADIDGVVVIPEYRGYGLQLHMLDFIEPIARMHNIDNLFAEISVENSYSLDNFLKKDYEIVNRYYKHDYIDRYVLLKKINN